MAERDLLIEDPPARPVVLDAAKAAIAVAAFFRLAAAWDLSADESRILLGRPSRAVFFEWKAGRVRRVPFDTVQRISWLLGIWKALRVSPNEAVG